MTDFSDKKILTKHMSQPFQANSRLFDEIGPYYLSATAEQRVTIRNAFTEASWNHYIAYIKRIADELRDTADTEKLRLGLVAACIENCRFDYRDTLSNLAILYRAAESAGIDPKPYFQEMANLASDRIPLGGDTSMKEILTNFHTYAIVKKD